MSLCGPVDVEWRCPVCQARQPDTMEFAGTSNRARADLKCVGCDAVVLVTLAAYVRVVMPVAAEEAKDGDG